MRISLDGTSSSAQIGDFENVLRLTFCFAVRNRNDISNGTFSFFLLAPISLHCRKDFNSREVGKNLSRSFWHLAKDQLNLFLHNLLAGSSLNKASLVSVEAFVFIFT